MEQANGIGLALLQTIAGQTQLPKTGGSETDEFQKLLEEKREVAVSVEVKAPVTVPVDVVVAVKPVAGLLAAPVVERVRQTVSAWFDGSRWW